MLVQAGLCRTCSETTLLVFPRGGSFILNMNTCSNVNSSVRKADDTHLLTRDYLCDLRTTIADEINITPSIGCCVGTAIHYNGCWLVVPKLCAIVVKHLAS